MRAPGVELGERVVEEEERLRKSAENQADGAPEPAAEDTAEPTPDEANCISPG